MSEAISSAVTALGGSGGGGALGGRAGSLPAPRGTPAGPLSADQYQAAAERLQAELAELQQVSIPRFWAIKPSFGLFAHGLCS